MTEQGLTFEQVMERRPSDERCPVCGGQGAYEGFHYVGESGCIGYQDAACVDGHQWREISTTTSIVAIDSEGEEVGTAWRLQA